MKKISGFTFVYNAINAGIPIRESILAVVDHVDELLVIDAGSNDGTTELLHSITKDEPHVRVMRTGWGDNAGETLRSLHAMHKLCEHDVIIHFEADEVYDELLIHELWRLVQDGHYQIGVPRLQVEQNFQRVRWYPELVHRVFVKNTVVKVGHTTDFTAPLPLTTQGYLWDVTNCFRDNWLARIKQQAALWHNEPNYLMVPLHALHPTGVTEDEIERRLAEPHWTAKNTPLHIPEILLDLVGKTKYE